jgi:hypothetical protein
LIYSILLGHTNDSHTLIHLIHFVCMLCIFPTMLLSFHFPSINNFSQNLVITISHHRNAGVALAGVRVIVQAGWSDINAEQFLIIAKEAEKQAKLALLVDEDEDEDEDEDHDGILGKDIEDMNITKSTSKNDMRNDMNSRNSVGNLSQKRGVKVSHWNAERDSLLIGSCPHSWLFDRVGAVVHHGGAGSDSVVVLCCWVYVV